MANGDYKILYIKINGEYTPIGCLTENSFSETAETLSTTTRENTDGWGSVVPTAQGYSIPFSGVSTLSGMDGTIVSYDALQNIKRSRSLVEWQIKSDEGGNTEQGTGYITDLSNAAPVAAEVTFTGTITGSGLPETIAGVQPAAPINFANAAPAQTYCLVTWTKSITGTMISYRIYDDGVFFREFVGDVSQGTLSGLTESTLYDGLTCRAWNGDEESEDSNIISFTTAGATASQSDWTETDDQVASFIKNKPLLPMDWKGAWVQASYDHGMTVWNGSFMGVSLIDGNTDIFPPQPNGEPFNPYSGSYPDTTTAAKQLILGSRFTPDLAITITTIQFPTIAGYHYEVYGVVDPTGDQLISMVLSFTATATEMASISHPHYVSGGEIYDIVVLASEPDPTPTETVLNYNYTTPNNPNTPGTGVISQANNESNVLRINKTDEDGGNNSTFLLSLLPGDKITKDGFEWTIQDAVESGNTVHFTILPGIQIGDDGLSAITFTQIDQTNITHVLDASYWNTSPYTGKVSGLFMADGDYSTIVPDNNFYGVTVYIQEYNTSDNWYYMPIGGAASGGGEAGTIEIVDNLTTPDAAKALSANMGYDLNQKKAGLADDNVFTGTNQVEILRWDIGGEYTSLRGKLLGIEVLNAGNDPMINLENYQLWFGDNSDSAVGHLAGIDNGFGIKTDKPFIRFNTNSNTTNEEINLWAGDLTEDDLYVPTKPWVRQDFAPSKVTGEPTGATKASNQVIISDADYGDGSTAITGTLYFIKP